jgi:hypothetical protein
VGLRREITGTHHLAGEEMIAHERIESARRADFRFGMSVIAATHDVCPVARSD